jgi:hypothetical protein
MVLKVYKSNKSVLKCFCSRTVTRGYDEVVVVVSMGGRGASGSFCCGE